MIVQQYKHRTLIIFLLKFAGFFLIFYLVTLAVIGVAAPGGRYIPFVAEHLDYVSGIKNMILTSVQFLLHLCNISTSIEAGYKIRIVGGKAVIVAMSCVGYTVYSVWLAYIIASAAGISSKIIWAVGGLCLLFLINVLRIAGFLYTYNKGTAFPLGLDHHTWFNIMAYTVIFVMIICFDRALSKPKKVVFKPK